MSAISSEVLNLETFFSAASYEPAKVQREYCWETTQIETLLDDLVSAFSEFGSDPQIEEREQVAPSEPEDRNELAFDLPLAEDEVPSSTYFLGTVVVQPHGNTTYIYDGLQRFTTLTVLFCVLRDRLQSNEFDHLITASAKPRLNMPLKHRTFDVDILAAGRTLATYARVANLSEPGKRLRQAAETIRNEFDDWSAARLAAFGNFMRTLVQVSVLRIEDRRAAGKAFTTINNTGIQLRDEEIVKGQLIELATEHANPEAAETEILRVWKNLQDDFGTDFGQFLKAVDFLERRKPQGHDVAIQLMEHIGRRYRGASGFKWVTQALPQYAAGYRWIHEGQASIHAKGEAASLRRLALLPWHEWKAVAMLIRFKATRAQDRVAKLDLLDRRCFAMHLALDPRPRASVLARAIEHYAPRGRRFTLVLSEPVKAKALRSLKKPVATHVGRQNSTLRWIEAIHHENNVPLYVCKQGNSGSTVEHVYPKNPGSNWPQFEAETAAEQATLVQSLGNLCLLPKDELGNKAFSEKKKEYRKANGFVFAQQIGRAPEWTPDSIRDRTSQLIDFVSAKLDL